MDSESTWMQCNNNRYYYSTKGPKICWIVGNNDFKASIGWLDKFKQRYSIKEYNKHGESQSAPIEKIPQMREELKKSSHEI